MAYWYILTSGPVRTVYRILATLYEARAFQDSSCTMLSQQQLQRLRDIGYHHVFDLPVALIGLHNLFLGELVLKPWPKNSF